MRPASAKSKGRRLQQAVMRAVLATFPPLTPDDVTSRSMGASGTDLLLSSFAKRLFPYAVEVKCQERVNLWAALEQARENAGGMTPLVVLARNQQAPVAVVDLQEFLWLAHRARGAGGNG